eukprot:5575958-Prymnesium_polylepis.1
MLAATRPRTLARTHAHIRTPARETRTYPETGRSVGSAVSVRSQGWARVRTRVARCSCRARVRRTRAHGVMWPSASH